MADKKISELTAAAALAGTEAVPIVQGGETVKTTAQDIADLAAATPGGSTTEIQFNNAGAFDGDPDFTWVGGAALTSGVGLTNKRLAAFGNFADLADATFAPGDVTNGFSVGAPFPLAVNNFWSGDLSAHPWENTDILSYNGYEHTGVGNAFLFSLDISPVINGDSTGPFSAAAGVYGSINNYGSGNIGSMFGLQYAAAHYGSGTVATLAAADLFLAGSGDATNAFGARVRTPFDGSGFVNLYGLLVQDQSGIGSALSLNILSEGATSNNVFEGTVTVGKASGNTGDIKFIGTTSGTVTLTTADAAGTWTMKLPSTDGNAGEVLKTDGSGVTSWAPFASPAPVVLTDGATPALDASLGSVFTLSAAGDRTIAVPSNATSGQRIVIAHTASGGARTLALNTGAGGFRFGSDITALTATVDTKTDYIECIYNSGASKWDVITYVKGY
jgi:hypothetical protein